MSSLMRRGRREVEVFSLSFIDCICCGFGAVILLLVISRFGHAPPLEVTRTVRAGQVRLLDEQLSEIRGKQDLLNRELKGRLETLQKERMKLVRMSGELTPVRGPNAPSASDASAPNPIDRDLVSAYQTLSEEMRRLLADRARRPASAPIGGIPVDSEYVIFIVDTSSSMTRAHWDAAAGSVKEILSAYPDLKGLQIMDDEGKVMLDGTRGQWLADSAAQRTRITSGMKAWHAYSNSSPVEGIEEAIRTYWSPDRRISLYVLGDEFTGESIQKALDDVTRLNKTDAAGQRLVRIHAVGFPAPPDYPVYTSVRFATLMRIMCEQNNGTFVGVAESR